MLLIHSSLYIYGHFSRPYYTDKYRFRLTFFKACDNVIFYCFSRWKPTNHKNYLCFICVRPVQYDWCFWAMMVTGRPVISRVVGGHSVKIIVGHWLFPIDRAKCQNTSNVYYGIPTRIGKYWPLSKSNWRLIVGNKFQLIY